MKCMNCGAELNDSAYCPKCGCDVSVQKQAIVLSGLYYNQGLEKAQVRDLSGAIDMLRRSLKFNKLNVPARNLLGLVYFEMGEVVAALSEWVISKNIQPENNIAAEYIENLQQDANRLDIINQTIKKYNIALENCHKGNEDVAMIQLKKILAQNPKLIKGYHLLSLLYIRQGEYEKARKQLKKAIRIDKTNTTTLRFLKEIDEQTGTSTSFEPRFSIWSSRDNNGNRDENALLDASAKPAQPAFRETTAGSTIFNIAIGLLIGALAVWFLIMPARTQRITQEADRKTSEYSSRAAEADARITELSQQMKISEETVAVVAQAFSDYINSLDGKSERAVAVSYDTRRYSEVFASIFAEVLSGNGIRAILSGGITPTPVLTFATKEFGCAAGVMITASHNPPVYNGIKFKSSLGGPFSLEMTAAVEKNLYASPIRRSKDLVVITDFIAPYIEKIESIIDFPAIRESGISVLIDSVGGAGMTLARDILRKNGCLADSIFSEPSEDFYSRLPEPIEQNLGPLMEALSGTPYAFGAATDGDADRMGVCLDGVHWPLHDAVLSQNNPYAVSNRLESSDNRITLQNETGILGVFRWRFILRVLELHHAREHYEHRLFCSCARTAQSRIRLKNSAGHPQATPRHTHRRRYRSRRRFQGRRRT